MAVLWDFNATTVSQADLDAQYFPESNFRIYGDTGYALVPNAFGSKQGLSLQTTSPSELTLIYDAWTERPEVFTIYAVVNVPSANSGLRIGWPNTQRLRPTADGWEYVQDSPSFTLPPDAGFTFPTGENHVVTLTGGVADVSIHVNQELRATYGAPLATISGYPVIDVNNSADVVVGRFMATDEEFDPDRVLSLMGSYGLIEPPTITWAAPAHDGGSPITGYVIREYVDGKITEFEVDAATTSWLATGFGHAQVIAVNAQGRSVPVEVELPLA